MIQATVADPDLLSFGAGYYNEARILNPVTFDTIKTLPNMPGSVVSPLAGRTYPLEGTAVLLRSCMNMSLARLMMSSSSM